MNLAKKLTAAGIAILVYMGYPAFCQVDTPLKRDTLKEVSVKAAKIPDKTSLSPVQTLSGEELARLNSQNVADAVKHLAGVQLKDFGGIGGLKTINVRSLGTNHTAVFYDGLQISNAQNGQVDLGKFSLDNLELISLYNGNPSADLQPARAFASASLLALKPAEPSFGIKKDQVTAAFKTGSFGLLNPSVTWNHKLGKSTYSTVSAEWLKADGQYKFHFTDGGKDSLVTRKNSDVDNLRAEMNFAGYLQDSSRWSLRLYNYRSARGLPGAALTNKIYSLQRQWDDDVFVQGAYQKKFSERYQLLFNAKYSYIYTRYLDPEYLNIANRLDNHYTQNELYFSLANRYRLSAWLDLNLSADYSFSDLSANLYQFAYPQRHTGLIAFAPSLHISRFDVQAVLLETLVHDQVKAGPLAADRHILSPSVSFSYQPFESAGFKIRGFYKDIFRLPTFNDLYYTLLGSTTLKPEYAKQYDAGFTFSKGLTGSLQYVTVQADVYYNRIKDKIVAIPTGNMFRWTMVNLGMAEIYGTDISVSSSWKTGGGLDLNAGINYTWQNALDVTPGDYYKEKIPYAPANTGSFLSSLAYRSYGLSYNFTYTGERYNLRPNTPGNYMEPWYTHDISVYHTLQLGKTKLRLQGEMNNLLGQQYEIVRNYPVPGRNFRLSLKITY